MLAVQHISNEWLYFVHPLRGRLKHTFHPHFVGPADADAGALLHGVNDGVRLNWQPLHEL
jgi:hypothetical protein